MNLNSSNRLLRFSLSLLCILSLFPCGALGTEKKQPFSKAYTSARLPSSVVPTTRTDDNWMLKHDALVKRAHESQSEIVFFGDSITDWMNEALLHKIFGPRADHFGIAGDRTQNLLWRLRHGELEFTGKVKPGKLVVLIGTNNTKDWQNIHANTNQEIVMGVRQNLDEIRKHLPSTKILLLAILPRDENPDTPLRKRIVEINGFLKKLADHKHIWFADIGPELLEKDGKISPEIMSDFLHPTKELGYERMFQAIKPHTDSLPSN